MKKGFTIVELLMVVAIIGILLGLSVTAVTGVIKKGREQQADACVALVNQGTAAYNTMKGDWPGSFRKDPDNQQDYHELNASEVKSVVYDLVKEAHDGKPPMDISGLFVSKQTGERGMRAYGMDFMTAIRGTKKNPAKMSASQMNFGYPEKERGYFRRFAAKYYPSTDRLVFEKQEGD